MLKLRIMAALAVLLGVGSLSYATPLFSESFETPNIDSPGFQNFTSSTLSFENTWTLVSGDVDIIRDAYSPMPFPDGHQALDLNGYNPGAISTSIGTGFGSYTLSFWLSENGGSGAQTTVSLNGTPIVPDFTSDSSGWTQYSYVFSAAGATVLQFQSTAPGGASGPTLDMVTVSRNWNCREVGPAVDAVPLPAAVWQGGLTLVGLGAAAMRRARKKA